MSLYLVRPKSSSLTRSLSLMSRKLTRQSRLAQAKEVTQFWQDDPVYQEISRWLEDAQGSGIIPIAQPETMITGTVLVQMSSADAEGMRQDLPDAEVLPDQPIELIRPLRDDSKSDILLHQIRDYGVGFLCRSLTTTLPAFYSRVMPSPTACI